jgi:hypothetical protein
MTDINHRRKNRKPVDKRYSAEAYWNGFPRYEGQERGGRTGRTGYLDKSLHGSSRKSELADRTVAACIGNDFSKGHRGMAKATRGAKKFVRSRTRFHENSATQKLARALPGE